MLEKITFVSARDLTGCTLLNPKFMEVCRKADFPLFLITCALEQGQILF